MYTYNFSDETTENIQEKTSKIDDLQEKFNQIDAKYDFSSQVNEEDYQTSLDLQRKTFEGLSDDQIKKQAEDSLFDYQSQKKESIENDYMTNKQALEQSLSSLEQDTKEAKDELNEAFTQAKENASNDAVKRGLARSSIIVNKLAKYDQAMLQEFSNIEKSYLETSSKLTAEKNLLEVQRQNALDSFDITYAIKLSEKFNGISEQLSAKENEVLEYNNKMEQLEKEYQAEQLEKLEKAKQAAAKANIDYAEFMADGGSATVNSFITKEKYDMAKEYLNSLPKAQALWELQNNSMFLNQLKSGYNVLLTEMQSRND